MTSSVVVDRVVHPVVVDPYRPRLGGPSPRRSFTPAQKLAHVQAYEEAVAKRVGGDYLRANGLYSSQLSEWRRLRDAGVLEGRVADAKIGALTPEQKEIARLRGELARANQRLGRTEAALEIMGKAQALLESYSTSAELPESTETS